MLRLSIYCTLVSSPRHEINTRKGFGPMFTYQRCRVLRGRIAVRGLKDEMDGSKGGGASGQSWDPGLEIEVPFEQRPVNEYSSLKESTLYSWAELGPGSFFLRLGGLWLVTFTALGAPIAAASFNLSKDPLRFFLAAGTGTLFLVSLIVLRIYLGWSYVGDRLLSAVIPYEETGWYDGQMWVKPPEAVPLYLSEMAPYKFRGALNIGFQLSITIGILAANFLNYVFEKIKGGWGWRLSLGGAVVPALIITIGSLVLPETPNSMMERGKPDEARAKLQQIRGIANVEEEFDDLFAASEASRKVEHPWKNLLQRKYRPHLTMAIAIPFFQQLTGINVIMFYAPVLFKTIGFRSDASLMSAVITGGVNVLATVVSIYGVDKWGRRFLFIEGGIQMLICQTVVAICIGVKFGVHGDPGQLPTWYAIVVVLFICIYVAGFAWSWGPLGWLVPSEIFPLEIRSAAQSINVSVNMLFTFAVAQIFLTMLCHLKFGLFLFFGFFVMVMTVFIYFFLPETKNIPIEEMVIVWKEHWFWSRFMSGPDYPANGSVETRKNGNVYHGELLVCDLA